MMSLCTKGLSANQILLTYLNPRLKYNYFGLEKQPSAILKFYFRFQFGPYHRTRHVTRHQAAKFRPNQFILSGDMMLYLFSRWRPLRRNFTSGFTSGDLAHFLMSVSISKPNIVVQSAAEIQLFPLSKNKRPIITC